ncbi:MAG TPA: DUF3817 domain-containing protein [Bacteroidia bacterium]|jgi:integral membrane protein|nr:DUF3817 domain-containing protein [Bacteroidia bacterium]HRG53268.1 DUF3817 domain-containing protein [Bacteroidia bacterium]
MLTNKLNRFLKIGLAEGISFILLVGIAMPLKYGAGILQPVRVVGMLHGVLFILYGLLLLQVTISYKWSIWKAIAAFLLSFVPFGTFFLERLLKEEIIHIRSGQINQ